MEHAIYDTGHHYLVAQLRDGNPVIGLMVDKWGHVEDDLRAFDGGKPKLGSIKLNVLNTAKLAAHGTYLARLRDGKVVAYSDEALESEEFCEYARIER